MELYTKQCSLFPYILFWLYNLIIGIFRKENAYVWYYMACGIFNILSPNDNKPRIIKRPTREQKINAN